MTETWISDQMELSVYWHVNQPLKLPISKLLVDFVVGGVLDFFFVGFLGLVFCGFVSFCMQTDVYRGI